MHIEQVLGDVPRAERCTCRESTQKGASAGEGSILRRFFGL
jgi:GTP cyclohydrolase II